jgi:hypothetical protein
MNRIRALDLGDENDDDQTPAPPAIGPRLIVTVDELRQLLEALQSVGLATQQIITAEQRFHAIVDTILKRGPITPPTTDEGLSSESL